MTEVIRSALLRRSLALPTHKRDDEQLARKPLQPQISRHHRGIGAQLRRRSLKRHAARFKNITARRDFERQLHILLDQKDRGASAMNGREGLVHFLDRKSVV